MKKIIGIDSNVFIWGIRGVASLGQDDRIKTATNFIKWVESKEWNILLPAPMIAEILSPVPIDEHQAILSLIDRRFIVAPFDLPAARKCAELLHKSFTDSELIAYRTQNAVPRQKMKYDCMIAAICIVRKVDTIYTEDGDIEKFSNGQVLVKPMPPLALSGIQSDLFGNVRTK